MRPSAFYATVSSCANTTVQCPGIVNSRITGWPPRGFYTEVTTPPLPLLVVCKNPGHLLPDEAELYMRTPREALAEVHMAHAAGTFSGGNTLTAEARRSTTFHKNLLRYVAHILDVEVKNVFKHCAYTNLVKCSTIGERDPLHPMTMRQCFIGHFSRELAYFQPKVLLAFGREVEKFLSRARDQRLHQLPVIYMKHPSYYYRRDLERGELARIRIEVRRYTDV
jgi:Uracil DNA glycosylase superfamily